jgi:Ca-activated chloride channel family protein
MTFIWPPMLLAILLVPAGALLARRIAVASRVGERAGGDGASTRGRVARGVLDRLPAVLAGAAMVVLAFALARPQATVALPRLEGTLMLVFDVSGSMAATDVAPSRMGVAKTAAHAIVDARPDGVVIGVVAFSDAGIAVQPPTSDTAAIGAAIDRMAPTRGTSLGSGILAALGAIDKARADTPPGYYSNRSPAPSPTPTAAAPGSDAATMVVVLSDGENNQRPDPQAAAKAAADRGIRIVALGVGTTAGTNLDLDGFTVDTRLDEATLRSIADTTAGAYLPVADATPGEAVYDELARSLVVRSEPLEVTGLVAGAALALLVAGAVLALARTGRLP